MKQFAANGWLSWRWFSTWLLVGLLSAGLAAATGAVQEEAPPANQGKARSEFRGRLPMFYSRVVTSEQREQIYAIQRKYQKQIDELTAQLRALQAQRDEEIHAVLTPEQQKQIAAWMEELRQRREAARAAGDSQTDADSEEESAEEPQAPPPARTTTRRPRGNQNP